MEELKDLGTLENGCSVPSREKYWKELDAEGKIERMRNIIKCLESKIENIEDKAGRTHNQFVAHKHLNGDIVESIGQGAIPYGSGMRGFGGLLSPRAPQNPDETYF